MQMVNYIIMYNHSGVIHCAYAHAHTNACHTISAKTMHIGNVIFTGGCLHPVIQGNLTRSFDFCSTMSRLEV